MPLQQIILALYSFLLAITLLLVSPILLLRPKTRAGLKEKLGFIPRDLQIKFAQHQPTIWIHAVSVGEFNGAYPLIQAIKSKFPHWRIVISTTTKAGQEMAKQRAGQIAQIIYFPFDLPCAVNGWLSLINPKLVIIFETELWANFISSCFRRKTPVFLFNARMSPRSFNRYKKIKWLWSAILNKLTLIGAQTANEAQNYHALAGNNVNIKVFGNLKYDWPASIDDQARKQLRNNLGITDKDLLIVAGSTHFEEEALILQIQKRFPSVKIIIAPRHPERFDEVAKIIEDNGHTVSRYTQSGKFSAATDIYLLDTIGELANFYSIASVAFVGGTIAKIGGHNLLEPYLYAVPAVCGPHLFKTQETAAILSNAKALFIGKDAQDVQDRIIQLLEDHNLRTKMGKVGQSWLENNRGAVSKSMQAIAPILENDENAAQTPKIPISKKQANNATLANKL